MVRNHWIALMTGTLGIGCVDLDFGGDTAEPNLPNLISPWFNYENLGDTYEFSVQVENQGYANADSFSVDLYLDQDTEPGESHMGDLREMLVSGLAAGDVSSITFSVPSESVCMDCSTWAYVDSGFQVTELEERDNAWGPMVILSR